MFPIYILERCRNFCWWPLSWAGVITTGRQCDWICVIPNLQNIWAFHLRICTGTRTLNPTWTKSNGSIFNAATDLKFCWRNWKYWATKLWDKVATINEECWCGLCVRRPQRNNYWRCGRKRNRFQKFGNKAGPTTHHFLLKVWIISVHRTIFFVCPLALKNFCSEKSQNNEAWWENVRSTECLLKNEKLSSNEGWIWWN